MIRAKVGYLWLVSLDWGLNTRVADGGAGNTSLPGFIFLVEVPAIDGPNGAQGGMMPL